MELIGKNTLYINLLLTKFLSFFPFHSIVLIDYNFAEAELTFPPGTEIGDTQCLGILIENDNNAEPSENFLLNLMPATPLIYIETERKNYTVTILDNDREYIAFSKFLARIVHV